MNPPAWRAVSARAAFFLLPESSDPELLSLLSLLLLLLLLLFTLLSVLFSLMLLESSSRTMVSGSPPGEFLAFFPEFEVADVDDLLFRGKDSDLNYLVS